MADDSDWVSDVRRWVQIQPPASTVPLAAKRDTIDELGYEAANPSLQDADWAAPPRTAFTDLR